MQGVLEPARCALWLFGKARRLDGDTIAERTIQ